MSMLGRWDPWYSTATEQKSYGDTTMYFEAEKWLRGLDVEDWGCGYGWFHNVHTSGGYVGIDGTYTPWCDVVADLREYKSCSEGILLRGVLEHNYEWQKVLDNAVSSFTKRLCVILFTPLVEQTKIIAENVGGLGVPDIAFNIDDILSRIGDLTCSIDIVPSSSGYGPETVLKVQR